MSESRLKEKTNNLTALEAQIRNFPENKNVSITESTKWHIFFVNQIALKPNWRTK